MNNSNRYMTDENINKIQKIWPGYHVEGVLGQGGFGRVYKVSRESLGAKIFSAVKVVHIPPEPSQVEELISEGYDLVTVKNYFHDMVNDFLRENKAMEDLKGASNIVIIEDSYVEQEEDGIGWTIFIRMEYLESLKNLVKAYELNAEDIVTLGIDICNALIVCEQKSIVHRDIKPDNIFINEFGNFKLGDFGAARKMNHLKTSMTQIGTSMYMAPELFRGDKADNRVDIYSLGIMLYRFANYGRFPFMKPAPHPVNPGDREEALLVRLKGEAVPLPSGVPMQLGQIIAKACAFRPEDRYQSANELKAELEKWKFLSVYGKEENFGIRAEHSAQSRSESRGTPSHNIKVSNGKKKEPGKKEPDMWQSPVMEDRFGDSFHKSGISSTNHLISSGENSFVKDFHREEEKKDDVSLKQREENQWEEVRKTEAVKKETRRKGEKSGIILKAWFVIATVTLILMVMMIISYI